MSKLINHTPEVDALLLAAQTLVTNAVITADPDMGNATDVYTVPLDDLDKLREILEQAGVIQPELIQAPEPELSFKEALQKYVRHCQRLSDEYVKHGYGDNYSDEVRETLVTTQGPRYVKVIREAGHGRSVHSFVDKSNGDVLKPDGWKKPAKHARGNIYDGAKDTTKYGVNHFGPHYLK